MSNAVINGVRLVYATGQCVRKPDDFKFPFVLYLNCRPPDFMELAFIAMHGGSEEVIVEGESESALMELVRLNEWETHPRLRELTIMERDAAGKIISTKSVAKR